MEEKKPWYLSKIVGICAAATLVVVTNHLTGFVSANVTPEQLQSIQALDPAVAETVKAVKDGQNWFSAAGGLLFSIIAAVRVWWTKAKIA